MSLYIITYENLLDFMFCPFLFNPIIHFNCILFILNILFKIVSNKYAIIKYPKLSNYILINLIFILPLRLVFNIIHGDEWYCIFKNIVLIIFISYNIGMFTILILIIYNIIYGLYYKISINNNLIWRGISSNIDKNLIIINGKIIRNNHNKKFYEIIRKYKHKFK